MQTIEPLALEFKKGFRWKSEVSRKALQGERYGFQEKFNFMLDTVIISENEWNAGRPVIGSLKFNDLLMTHEDETEKKNWQQTDSAWRRSQRSSPASTPCPTNFVAEIIIIAI